MKHIHRAVLQYISSRCPITYDAELWRGGEYLPDKGITLNPNSKYSLQEQIATLLHEFGHHELLEYERERSGNPFGYRTRTGFEYDKRFSYNNPRKIRDRIIWWHEEFMAWFIGYKTLWKTPISSYYKALLQIVTLPYALALFSSYPFASLLYYIPLFLYDENVTGQEFPTISQ